MQPIYDVIIIGGGAAGYSAALYTARAGLSTLVLEKLSPGGQMATTDQIDNYPGFPNGIDGFTLGMQMQEGAQRFGTNTEYTEVLSLDLAPKIKTIRTDSGDFSARTVILATGAFPKELGLAREKELWGKGVHYCAHCDGRFYKDKTVLVVGGGNSAVADALYLSRLCKEVVLVHRRDSLRATKIYHEPLMKAPNVRFYWDSRIVSLHGDDRLHGVTVENLKSGAKTELPLDGLFISIGRSPETALFAGQIQLDEKGYIAAGEDCTTSLPGVFAAGDVRTKAVRQVITAAADGAVAATMAENYLAAQEM